MQVSTRSNNYNQAPRSSGAERKSDDQDVGSQVSNSRRGDAITGSKAVLSKTLADALWSIQRSSTAEDGGAVGTVEDLYRAYAA